MKQNIRAFAAAGGLLIAMSATEAALAQKPGGVLKMYTVDSPASISILEEATVFAERPMMHLGHADRQVEREATHQPSQVLVS